MDSKGTAYGRSIAQLRPQLRENHTEGHAQDEMDGL